MNTHLPLSFIQGDPQYLSIATDEPINSIKRKQIDFSSKKEPRLKKSKGLSSSKQFQELIDLLQNNAPLSSIKTSTFSIKFCEFRFKLIRPKDLSPFQQTAFDKIYKKFSHLSLQPFISLRTPLRAVGLRIQDAWSLMEKNLKIIFPSSLLPIQEKVLKFLLKDSPLLCFTNGSQYPLTSAHKINLLANSHFKIVLGSFNADILQALSDLKDLKMMTHTSSLFHAVSWSETEVVKGLSKVDIHCQLIKNVCGYNQKIGGKSFLEAKVCHTYSKPIYGSLFMIDQNSEQQRVFPWDEKQIGALQPHVDYSFSFKKKMGDKIPMRYVWLFSLTPSLESLKDLWAKQIGIQRSHHCSNSTDCIIDVWMTPSSSILTN